MAGGKTIIIVITFLISAFFLSGGSSATKPPHVRRAHSPCKTFVVYYHDTRYNGSNSERATSAIVGEPAWANKTGLAPQNSYGDMIAFDDPLTADGGRGSPEVGRAQGFYLYVGRDDPRAWHGFSMVFNSMERRGVLNLAGLNVMMNKTRDIPVVGGSGDFFMHRGIATFTTDVLEDGDVYFRLRIEVKLYECWTLV